MRVGEVELQVEVLHDRCTIVTVLLQETLVRDLQLPQIDA